MPGAYPRALRERVVGAYNDGEGSYEEIAARFSIGRATVDRWLCRERTTGTVDAKPQGGARHPRVVQAAGEDFIREILDLMPDSTLDELCEAYAEKFGTRMHVRTMGRSVARMGITRKRGL